MHVVFDLDGTLALTDHRNHLVRGPVKDWDAFYAACGDDIPCWPAICVLFGLLDDGHSVVIWTGRREDQRKATHQWFRRHGLPYALVSSMLMRPVGDLRPDVDLKRGWLRMSRDEGFHPDLAFEDRDRVVAMWREEGVPCFQVAPGDY